MRDIDKYLEGNKLYGDDFSSSEIEEWFREEEEGYADLGAKKAESYKYVYHALNRRLGFDSIRGACVDRVLGFGSAYGDELLPVAEAIKTVTIVDPSSAFIRPSVLGKPATFIKPSVDGRLSVESNSFDLITCFGVLHHIPNVSAVIKELARVLAPGGHMLIREPIISLGDWRVPRRGLTKRERGIPLKILRAFIQNAGLEVVRESVCMFPVTTRLFRWLRDDPLNSTFAVSLDVLVSSWFRWNINYHPRNRLQFLRPTAAFFVLRKRASP